MPIQTLNDPVETVEKFYCSLVFALFIRLKALDWCCPPVVTPCFS